MKRSLARFMAFSMIATSITSVASARYANNLNCDIFLDQGDSSSIVGGKTFSSADLASAKEKYKNTNEGTEVIIGTANNIEFSINLGGYFKELKAKGAQSISTSFELRGNLNIGDVSVSCSPTILE